jgi:hypothetical protein
LGYLDNPGLDSFFQLIDGQFLEYPWKSQVNNGRPLNQPLYFFDIREQLEGTGLLLNPLGDDTINPTDTPTLGVGGSGIPPSPPHSSPSSSGGESSDKGS